jgi:hypothetical protein
MYASDVISRRRNLALYNFFREKPLQQPEQPSYQSQLIVNDRIMGGQPVYYNSRLVSAAPATPTISDFIPVTLDETVMMALGSALSYCASARLGPTRTSRFFYLWFVSVVSGYSWITTGRINGTHDNWDWNIHWPLESENDRFIYMNHLLIDIMPILVPGSTVGAAIAVAEKQVLGWSDDRIAEELARVRLAGHYTDWLAAWNTWRSNRASDGSVAAAAVPDPSVLPNGNQTLNVATSTDDPNTFTEPRKWVPLIVDGVKKNYLTYGWNDVLSTGLTAGQETTIKAAAQVAFPTDWARDAEVDALLTLSQTLTDEQKVIAEFWAGGPTTVSPPGMFIYIWKQFMTATLIAHVRGYDYFFYSGLELAINLFEAGRLTWGLKRANMQARPIQEIRRLYRGTSLIKYDGTTISGELWVPYQETNFVTPPFADFPSGHSSFSKVFSLVMGRWFGDAIPSTRPINWNDLSLICPLFGAETGPFGRYVIPAQSSVIETGVVPAAAITLTWPTWSSMAESAGISRQYGGIHCISAHVGSVALGDALFNELLSVWDINAS